MHIFNRACFILHKVNLGISKLERFLLGFAVFTLTALLFGNVLCRYIFLIPTAWIDELSRYILVYIGVAGAAAVSYEWDNIRIDLVDDIIKALFRNNEKGRVIVQRAVDTLAVLITSVFLIYFTTIFYRYIWQVHAAKSMTALLHVSMVIPTLAVLIELVFLCIHCISYLIVPESIRKPGGKNS